MFLGMLGRWRKIGRKVRDKKGFTLVEIVIVLIVVGITVVPLSRLSVKNLVSGGRYAIMTRAIFYAEGVMEHILADYNSPDTDPGDVGGYDNVQTNWYGPAPDCPAEFSGYVDISVENTLNGVNYVVVTVTVSGAEISDVTLTTWIVDTN